MKLSIGLGVALCVMTWLYMEKRDELASTIEKANTDKIRAVLAAEQKVSGRLRASHSEELARQAQRQRDSENALRDAQEAAEQARMGLDERNRRITQLELEASIDDIPDSGECLNVYVPDGVLHTRDCGEAGFGGNNGHGVCVNTGRPDQTATGFSSVTFSELISITNQNIATIDALNGQLSAIDDLNN